MTTQLELAKHALFDKGGFRAADIKLYPGTNRDATPEQMAQQVNRALAQLTSGDYEVVNPLELD
jgi:hypothetical protein